MKNYKLIVIYCLLLNFSNCYSDMKKSWLSTQSTKNQIAPNLEPDLPKFTPFNNNDDDSIMIIDNISGDKSNTSKLIEEKTKEKDVKELNEPFQLNKDDESFIDKLLPFSDYMYDIYDNFKNFKNKKHKKNKNKQNAEKLQDQDHDHDFDNEFATEIITEKQEDDENATVMVDVSKNEDQLSLNGVAEGDNSISNADDRATDSPDPIWKFRKSNKLSRYNVGPGVNVSLDVPNEVVRVQLDENCLKDVFTGRGKKKQLITKSLALFILPFLIQTSFVPFLLTTIKLMLVNSMVVGKIAILLFLIALFKNHKLSGSTDSMPYYLDTGSHHMHHRRSETDNKGYEAVGKPETYIT